MHGACVSASVFTALYIIGPIADISEFNSSYAPGIFHIYIYIYILYIYIYCIYISGVYSSWTPQPRSALGVELR
jgi:hypothetical protein